MHDSRMFFLRRELRVPTVEDVPLVEVPVPVPRPVVREVTVDRHVPVPHPVPVMQQPVMPAPVMPAPMPAPVMAAPMMTSMPTTTLPTYGASYGSYPSTYGYGGLSASYGARTYAAPASVAAPAVGTPPPM